MLELNNDQRRELINSRQRFEAVRNAAARRLPPPRFLRRSDRMPGGSGRSAFAVRRPSVKRLNSNSGRAEAKARHEAALEVMVRQAAINRALGLGRVPLLGAKIIRALDDAAYGAAAGAFVDPGLTTTEDIDLLFDSRAMLRFVATEEVAERGLLGLLKRVDRSFERTSHGFRAANDKGYLVDLVKAPAFEAMAIDERGAPLKIVTVDPRAFATQKLWVSRQFSRDPVKRIRDDAQARAVAKLVTARLEHLVYRAEELEMPPRAVFDAATSLFSREIAGE